jgi:hypothetical protein
VGTVLNRTYRNCAGVLGEYSQHHWYCSDGGISVGCHGPDNGPNCFLPDTLITLADGSQKKVRELKTGDEVRGHTGTNRVVRVPTFKNDQAIYGFNGGEKFVTGGHPFYTKEGWKAIDPSLTSTEGHAVKTTKLQPGDRLLLSDGEPFTIKTIDAEKSGAHELYNPIMDGDHTYYAAQFLVHNKDENALCHLQASPDGWCMPGGTPTANTDGPLDCCSGISGGNGNGCIGDGPGTCSGQANGRAPGNYWMDEATINALGTNVCYAPIDTCTPAGKHSYDPCSNPVNYDGTGGERCQLTCTASTYSGLKCVFMNKCPGSTAYWGSGCSGTYSDINPEGSVTVINSAPGHTGATTVTCGYAGGSGTFASPSWSGTCN